MTAPLVEKIKEYCRKKYYHFHIPGHNQGKGLPESLLKMEGGIFNADLTELDGLDDLHNPAGVINRAQELTVKLYNVDKSYFLVNGTTCGVQALIMAATREQDHVLVPRNAHRSLLSGLIFSGATPVYMQPEIVPFFAFPAGIKKSDLDKQLDKYNIKAVFQVHPTYYGTTADLKSVILSAHNEEVPVIVDEAHGSHLYFSEKLPCGAMEYGADAAVQSVHKTGGSLTQSSWLHLQGSLINKGKLESSLRLVQSTSPSYILMCSLDAAREQFENRKDILERILNYSYQARKAISKIKGLVVLDEENSGGGYNIDPTRLVISVKKLGLTGYRAKEILRKQYRVELEMADFNNLVAIIGPGTSEEDIDMLVKALQYLSRDYFNLGGIRDMEQLSAPAIPALRLTPRQAWMLDSHAVQLSSAVGEVCAETVCIYPPGIPVICPGEKITEEIKDYLMTARKLGLHCQGPADPGLEFIRVVG